MENTNIIPTEKGKKLRYYNSALAPITLYHDTKTVLLVLFNCHSDAMKCLSVHNLLLFSTMSLQLVIVSESLYMIRLWDKVKSYHEL